MVEYDLAKVNTGVRFSSSAPYENKRRLIRRFYYLLIFLLFNNNCSVRSSRVIPLWWKLTPNTLVNIFVGTGFLKPDDFMNLIVGSADKPLPLSHAGWK